jgi:hypothetical protein
MLIELAPVEGRKELDRLITWGIRRDFLELDQMRFALARAGRRRGLANLKAA